MKHEQSNVKLGDKSSIQIVPHSSKKTLSKIRKIINEVFFERTEHYLNMHVEAYRKLMIQAQNTINRNK